MTTRPRLLDLFCGAGGAAMGYHRAGFDVTGVDINPQPRYPFTFHQADAAEYPLDGFDAIHGSPPCEDHSVTRNFHLPNGTAWLLPHTRKRFQSSGLPWVIENTPGAPMRVDYELCGCMFGLPRLIRRRWFETSWHGFELRAPCWHPYEAVTVLDGGHGTGSRPEQESAMGIDWMTRRELAKAIPPAYTEHLGRELLSIINANAGAGYTA
jgi:DNA (cytosine-5)-methyltransferase 1